MKTSEFIKKVEEFGYEVVNNDSCTKIYRNSCIVAEVLELAVNLLNTNYYESVSDVLFNVLVEYARTPIEEREDFKKYYLYNLARIKYFNYWFAKEEYHWYNSKTQTFNMQTQFTEEEIKNHKLRDIMELLVKEEVE